MARDAPRSTSPQKRKLANSSTPAQNITWVIQPQPSSRSPTKSTRGRILQSQHEVISAPILKRPGVSSRPNGRAIETNELDDGDKLLEAFGSLTLSKTTDTPLQDSVKTDIWEDSAQIDTDVTRNTSIVTSTPPVDNTGTPSHYSEPPPAERFPQNNEATPLFLLSDDDSDEDTNARAQSFKELANPETPSDGPVNGPSDKIRKVTIRGRRIVESDSDSDLEIPPVIHTAVETTHLPVSSPLMAVEVSHRSALDSQPKGRNVKLVRRRIETDSESESEAAQQSLTEVHRPIDPSLKNGDTIEISSGEDDMSGAVSRKSSDLSGAAVAPAVDQSIDEDEDEDDAGVLVFSRIPSSPSKRSTPLSALSPSPSPAFPLSSRSTFPSSSSPASQDQASPPQRILTHRDSDSSTDDEDEVNQLLSGTLNLPPRPKNKRLSVWSTKDEEEIIAISSSSSSTSDDSDSDHASTSPRNYRPPPPKVKPVAKPSSSPKKRPATTPATKKAPSKKAYREQLVQYALNLYASLNAIVFGGRLYPAVSSDDAKDTCLIVWSNTLKKTAGRAVIARTTSTVPGRLQTQRVSIELATKVVDTEERIRHTLAHEMCHLAVWMLDKVKENDHGPCFKAWANRVMKSRKDIEVTTRHSYIIAYKFEWKCVDCGQIYGRHSKSIRPSEQRCGRCKGQLTPLFEERTKEVTNGWTLFLKEQMPKVLASNPGMSRAIAMKEISKLWKQRGDGGSLDAADDDIAFQLSNLST